LVQPDAFLGKHHLKKKRWKEESILATRMLK